MRTSGVAYCPAGTDIKTEARCRAAAQKIGTSFGHAFSDSNAHHYCQISVSGGNVYFNKANPASPTAKVMASVCSAPPPPPFSAQACEEQVSNMDFQPALCPDDIEAGLTKYPACQWVLDKMCWGALPNTVARRTFSRAPAYFKSIPSTRVPSNPTDANWCLNKDGTKGDIKHPGNLWGHTHGRWFCIGTDALDETGEHFDCCRSGNKTLIDRGLWPTGNFPNGEFAGDSAGRQKNACEAVKKCVEFMKADGTADDSLSWFNIDDKGQPAYMFPEAADLDEYFPASSGMRMPQCDEKNKRTACDNQSVDNWNHGSISYTLILPTELDNKTNQKVKNWCPSCSDNSKEECPEYCHLRILRKGGLVKKHAFQGFGKSSYSEEKKGHFLSMWGDNPHTGYYYWRWSLTIALEKIVVCQDLKNGTAGELCRVRKRGWPVGGAKRSGNEQDTGLTCESAIRHDTGGCPNCPERNSNGRRQNGCPASDQELYNDPVFSRTIRSLFSGVDALLIGL